MKKNIKPLWIQFAMILSLAGILFAYSCSKDDNANSTPAPNPTTLAVRYEIRGTDCFVYCTGANGLANNFFHQGNSFNYSYNAKSGDTLRLIVQNTSGNPESISGYIYLNDSILASETSYCPINGTVIISDTLN